MKRPKIVELAWAAGLFEGEGSICLVHSNRKNRTYVYPALTMNQTDRDVIMRFSEIVGGYVLGPYQFASNSARTRKPVWSWRVQKKHEAIRVICWLYPYLGKRRRKRADEVFGKEVFQK
jgi:hypothetical protein